MENIEGFYRQTIVDAVLDKENGYLEIELLDSDIGSTDFFIANVAAIHFGTYSIDSVLEEMDFALEPIFSIEHAFNLIKGNSVSHVTKTSSKYIRKPADYFKSFNPLLYSSGSKFSTRIEIHIYAPDLIMEENEECYAVLHLDLIDATSPPMESNLIYEQII